MGNPGGVGAIVYHGGGGGGGAGMVDASRTTVVTAQRGGGGRGGVNNQRGQDGSIRITWRSPGQPTAVGDPPEPSPGGGTTRTEADAAPASTPASVLPFSRMPTAQSKSLFGQVLVHMVSVHEPQIPGGTVAVRFTSVGQPFVLMLVSQQPVRWQLLNPPPTLRGVLAYSNDWDDSSLRGLPAGLPALRLTQVRYTNLTSTPCRELAPRRFICQGGFRLVSEASIRITGQPVTTVAQAYRAAEINVPGKPAAEK
jgi:hypothetical protein